jgi:hypothetical protein
MNRLRSGAVALPVLMLALAPVTARADQVGFSYSAAIDTGTVYGLSAGGLGPITLSQSTAPDGSSYAVNFGSGSASMNAAPGGNASATPGADYFSATPTPITVATFSTAALAGPLGDFSFTATAVLRVTLTDAASGQSGVFALTNFISGTVSPDGTFSLTGGNTDGYFSTTIGGHVYSLDLSSAEVTLPGPGQPGVDLVAQVYVDRPDPSVLGGGPGVPVPVVTAVPEPTGLTLAGAALSLVGLAALRRGRSMRRLAGWCG